MVLFDLFYVLSTLTIVQSFSISLWKIRTLKILQLCKFEIIISLLQYFQ